LAEKYPWLNIVFIASEWSEAGYELAAKSKIKMQNAKLQFKMQNYTKYDDAFITSLKDRHIDILFVAFGFPKQELWMREHVGKIPVTVMMGVGGAFDYFSGEVPRAPAFLRRVGLEWLYRLIRQPWRVRRQTALLDFALLVLRKRLNLS
jgi:N-acetylglucosaminyldiphosphoundecaprenol N-acetyl-beta-D-mannosaminyltransferase